MGYQALLFCPDEKAARGVTQVLSELDFAVEPCTEPFAAVKKLMAQHFDAIVVDCDNEQNATLLFKSARNSSSNQSSLAVAVVEGQAGVAKAFRIGANLVLTKPINVEQAKGTLRVARGLLRKGGDPVKPVAEPTVTPAGAAPVTPSLTVPKAPAASPRLDTTSAPSTAAATKSWPVPERKPAPAQSPQPEAPRSAASAATLATDVAPKMDGSAKLDIAAKPATKPAPVSPQPAPPQKKYAWQASKAAAEPMSSALKKAAEAAGIAASPSHASPSVPAATPSATAIPSTFGSAVAAAPAKAPVPTPMAPPVEEEPAVAQPKATPPLHRETGDHSFSAPELNPPTFSMGAPAVDEEEPGNSKKALIIVAIVIVLAAMAGYLFWKNMSVKPSAPAPASQVQTPTLPSAPAAASNPGSSSTPDANTTAPLSSSATSPAPVTPAPAPKPSSKIIAKDSTTAAAPVSSPASQPVPTAVAAPAAPALLVHNEPAKPAPKVNQTEADAAAPAPSSLGLTSTADPHALAAIGSAPVAVPKASTEVLKVSQGVSEGLVLKKVQPRYPTQALQMRKEGPVQLQATVGKDGSISNVKILSGDALLARAAQEAVKQWKYKPYYLNGEPVEIQTQITVNFKLPN